MTSRAKMNAIIAFFGIAYAAGFLICVSSCAHSSASSSASHSATSSTSTAVAQSQTKETQQWHGQESDVGKQESVEHKATHEVVTTETWEPTKLGKPKYTKRVVDKVTADEANTSRSQLSSSTQVHASVAHTAASSEAHATSAERAGSHSEMKTETKTPWPWKLIGVGLIAVAAGLWLARKWLAMQLGRFLP